jgi:anti-anti-sigma factor
MGLTFNSHPDSEFLIVAPEGQIAAGPEANYFNSRMQELARQSKKKIILDLSDVSYIDSIGLGVLMSVFSTLKAKGFTLIACGANQARVQGWFQCAKMDSVFLEIFEPLQEVLRKFAQQEEVV